jgi:hypothetical protein
VLNLSLLLVLDLMVLDLLVLGLHLMLVAVLPPLLGRRTRLLSHVVGMLALVLQG